MFLQKFIRVFQCKRCTGSGVDEEYGVIDGIRRVASFVYLGDELDARRGC